VTVKYPTLNSSTLSVDRQILNVFFISEYKRVVT
jgi:hypothetical protein